MTGDLVETTRKIGAIDKPMTVKDLMDKLDTECPESMDIEHWNKIVDELAKYDFGVAPNSLLFEKIPDLSDSIFLYRTRVNHRVNESGNPCFHIALLHLIIGAFIFSSAGIAFNKKLDKVAKTYKKLNRNISGSDMAGFKAHIKYFEMKPPTEDLIRKLKKNCLATENSSNPLKIPQAMVLNFTKGLNMTEPKEKSAGDKIHSIFELN